MATITAKSICAVCNKSKITYTCPGCSQQFCLDHISEHRKDLGQQLEEIQNDHDQLRQELYDQKTDTTKHSWIKQIDQWEKDSIEKIQQTAQQCRQECINHSGEFLSEMEKKLNELARQMKELYRENEFSEIDLNHLKEKLKKIEEELHRSTNLSIVQHSTSFINNISIVSRFDKDTRWKQFATTIAGGHGEGNNLNQLNCPHGLCFNDRNQTIYIADRDNDRILEWKLNEENGRVAAGGNGQGDRLDQLNQPTDMTIDRHSNALIITDRDNRRVVRWSLQPNSQGQVIISDIDCARLAIDEDGSLYVSNWNNNEVRRWKKGETQGTVVAGGNGQGNQLNQLHFPTFIFVDDDHTLYVSDRGNHRVMKWTKNAEEGVVVAGGNGKGSQTTQLFEPQGVIVDQFGHIYVADHGNHRVVRWCEGAKEGTVVVGDSSKGQEANQLDYPIDLFMDGEGNLFVSDYGNDRIQKFELDRD